MLLAGERAGRGGLDGADVAVADAARAEAADDDRFVDADRLRVRWEATNFLRADDERVERCLLYTSPSPRDRG